MTKLTTAAALLLASSAFAQSSSLYLEPQPAAARAAGYSADPRAGRLSPAVASWSLTAVPVPEPRQFAVNDLITIIVRESTETDWDAKLDTSKKTGFDGSLDALPKISWDQLLAPGGVSSPIDAKLDFKNDFTGDGSMSRGETITGRLQARIIDVKPNGTLALEARKYNQIDKETLTMTLTGLCRAEDVTLDNTVLSSQIYDLNLSKTHTGELRKATRKGVFTRLFEVLFNF